jgi:hypothetical protein
LGDAGHDDYLFIRLAVALREGQWLGQYNNLTLAKGMWFPLFIAFAETFGLSLPLAEQCLYLAAAFLCFFILRRVTRCEWFASLSFTLLALNPVFWNSQLSRVIREGMYISLGFGLYLLAFMILNHTFRSRKSKIMAAALTGVVGGAYWLTREEGVWLAPALAILLLFSATEQVLIARSFRNFWRLTGVAIAARWRLVGGAAAIAVLIVSTVAAINYGVYGVFTDVEFRANGFLSAYGALTRIQPDKWTPKVMFPHDARSRAYSASPAMKELEPYFEGSSAAGWIRVGCSVMVEIKPCTELLAGWFMWALRDAVAAAGHYRTGAAAEAFYGRIASEINGACAEEKLRCLPLRNTLLPPFRKEYLWAAMVVAPKAFKTLYSYMEPAAYESSGSPDRLAVFKAMVGPIARVTREDESMILIAGWVAFQGPNPTLQIVNRHTGQVRMVELVSAPDVDQAVRNRDLRGMRFSHMLEGPRKDSDLRVISANGETKVLSISSLGSGAAINTGSFILYLENLGGTAGGALAQSLETSRNKFLHRIASVFTFIYPPILIVGTFLALIGLTRMLWVNSLNVTTIRVSALCAAAMAAVITRCALLSYLEASSFPSIFFLYLSPATPFLIVLGITGTWLVISDPTLKNQTLSNRTDEQPAFVVLLRVFFCVDCLNSAKRAFLPEISEPHC